ncbi:MAG TPA: hypothetical protein DD426_14260, partial [Clostridiaceae bacterium]|nr:hypothetical protein [Clostridiaceae bacterium]
MFRGHKIVFAFYIAEYKRGDIVRNKKVISLFLIFLIVFSMTAYRVSAKTELPFDVNAKSALLMDFSSGKILYEKNSH